MAAYSFELLPENASATGQGLLVQDGGQRLPFCVSLSFNIDYVEPFRLVTDDDRRTLRSLAEWMAVKLNG